MSNTAAYQAIADSGGKAGVVIFTDSQYEIAVFKAQAMEAAIKKCGGCTVLEFVDSPIAETSQRMPQLTTTLLQKYGDKWTHSLAINDLYFDFMGPSLAAAGKKGDGAPHNRSPPATDRNPRSSASAPSSTRTAPCRSRSTCRAGSWSTS